MNILKRLSLALIVATIVSVLLTTVAYAAFGFVSETSAGFTSSGLSAAPGCSGATCQDSNALRGALSGSIGSQTRWGQWFTEQDNVNQWWTFIPNLAGNFGAGTYSIFNGTEVYYTVANQNNWKGTYVNIGTFSNNSLSARARLGNNCVSGFYCGTDVYLYYDKSRYAY